MKPRELDNGPNTTQVSVDHGETGKVEIGCIKILYSYQFSDVEVLFTGII
jgi:hypothetical protein